MDGVSLVTLLSDFGTADGYVGAMKGVILSLCREAHIVDIAHDIPPCNVFAGALALKAAAPRFPPGTIHVAVVDPGVGGKRAPLLVEAEGSCFIGPDNGLLSLAASSPRRVYHLDKDRYLATEISPTFHGRDVFAPIAGHLAAGATVSEVASLCDGDDSMHQLRLPEPHRQGRGWCGEVIHVDNFGNLITSLRREHIGEAGAEVVVEIGARRIDGISTTFSDVAEGALVAFIGSSGYLEIAVRGGSASADLGVSSVLDSRLQVTVSVRPR